MEPRRISPTIRLACVLLAIPCLLLLFLFLGSVGLSPIEVTGIEWTSDAVAMLVGLTTVGLFLVALGVTGWNPFYRLGLYMAKTRTEYEAAGARHRAKRDTGSK